MATDSRIPTMPGTEHVGFSPTRKALLAASAKRREVYDESHQRGACILLSTAHEADSGSLRVLSCTRMSASMGLDQWAQRKTAN